MLKKIINYFKKEIAKIKAVNRMEYLIELIDYYNKTSINFNPDNANRIVLYLEKLLYDENYEAVNKFYDENIIRMPSLLTK